MKKTLVLQNLRENRASKDIIRIVRRLKRREIYISNQHRLFSTSRIIFLLTHFSPSGVKGKILARVKNSLFMSSKYCSLQYCDLPVLDIHHFPADLLPLYIKTATPFLEEYLRMWKSE